jgi:hypothetical protein
MIIHDTYRSIPSHPGPPVIGAIAADRHIREDHRRFERFMSSLVSPVNRPARTCHASDRPGRQSHMPAGGKSAGGGRSPTDTHVPRTFYANITQAKRSINSDGRSFPSIGKQTRRGNHLLLQSRNEQ